MYVRWKELGRWGGRLGRRTVNAELSENATYYRVSFKPQPYLLNQPIDRKEKKFSTLLKSICGQSLHTLWLKSVVGTYTLHGCHNELVCLRHCLFVCWLLNGSAQTILRAATLR